MSCVGGRSSGAHPASARARCATAISPPTHSLWIARSSRFCRRSCCAARKTAGEIRARTGRMYDFADLDQVVGVLDGLASRETPLVTQLPRQPGQKEERYAHLLAGEATV